jgi:phosphate transport system substrate-binding protein
MARVALITTLGLTLAPAAAEEPERIIWRGCEISLNGFMRSCAAAFEQETGVHIELRGGGATLGIDAVAAGGATLGGSCRDALDHRGEALQPIRFTIVAWDGLVAITHPTTPITSLSRQQLRDVFQQRLTNWQDLGGPAQRIAVVCRADDDSGVGTMARQMVMGSLHERFGPTVIRLARASEGIEGFVASQPWTIALTGAASARTHALKILAVEGVQPTTDTIAHGSYSLFRPLYLVLHQDAPPAALRFRSWLLGPSGQAAIAAQGGITLAAGHRLATLFRHFSHEALIDNLDELRKLGAESR